MAIIGMAAAFSGDAAPGGRSGMITSVGQRVRAGVSEVRARQRKAREFLAGAAESMRDRLQFLGLVLWVIALPILLPVAVMFLFGNL